MDIDNQFSDRIIFDENGNLKFRTQIQRVVSNEQYSEYEMNTLIATYSEEDINTIPEIMARYANDVLRNSDFVLINHSISIANDLTDSDLRYNVVEILENFGYVYKTEGYFFKKYEYSATASLPPHL